MSSNFSDYNPYCRTEYLREKKYIYKGEQKKSQKKSLYKIEFWKENQ